MILLFFFFFKQKTAYEMRISDWSSDVCSSDLQKRAVERNTRNSYQTLVAGITEIEARRLAVVSADAAYDASQVGLEVGTRTVLDVLINQQNLFNARQAYAIAKYNYLQHRLLDRQSTRLNSRH